MKQSKKIFLFIFTVMFFTFSISAQKTKKKTTKTITTKTTTSTKSTTEAKTTETKTVETKSLFPEEQKKLDTSIGKKLSGLIKTDSMKANSSGGITVRRYISNEDGKLGADIFEPSVDSKFNSESIESILSSYIADNFEYNTDDSDLLANLILKFNKKNRKNQDYIIQNYSTNVVLATKKDKIGFPEILSSDKIAGQTQIIVPTEKNILKKLALDVASFEVSNNLKTELANPKEEEFSKKLARFFAKKNTSESDEIASKLSTATPAEVKGFNEKLSQLKLRDEMRKGNFSSEKEFLASRDTKKIITTTSTTTTINGISSVNAPELPKNKYTTFIHGANHAGINAREFIFVPGTGIISIGFDAAKPERKDLQVFISSNGDYLLKKSSEGIKLAPESPLAYSNGKIYVIELLKNEAFLIQFNSDLEFESRTEVSVNPISSIQFNADEVIVTAIEKTGSKNDSKTFKTKDLSQSK